MVLSLNVRRLACLAMVATAILATAGSAAIVPPAWMLPASSAAGSYAFSPAGDVNGDGFDDVVVGILQGYGGRGRADVYYGGPDGLSSTGPDWSAEGEAAGDWYGETVAAADVDGDGFSDVIVGAQSADEGWGRIYVYSGSGGGLSPEPRWTGQGHGDGFASVVASAGNVDGNRGDEIAVGSYAFGKDTGQASVYRVGEGGTLDPVWTLNATDIPGGEGILQFGWSIAGAGDVNADGFDDLVVGAPATTRIPALCGAFLFLGSRDGLSSKPDWQFTFLNTMSNHPAIGWAVAPAGDMNGDGFDDVLVAAPLHFILNVGMPGRVCLFQGCAEGLRDVETWAVDGPDMYAYFGTGLGSAGDYNSDGYADIIVGANNNRSWLYRGSAAGLPAVPDEFIATSWTSQPRQIHLSTLSPGDVNGDGASDLLLAGAGYAQIHHATCALEQRTLEGTVLPPGRFTILPGVVLSARFETGFPGCAEFEVWEIDEPSAPAWVGSSAVLPSGATASVPVDLPLDRRYRWQARFVPESGPARPWMHFRSHSNNEIDFYTRSNAAPVGGAPGQVLMDTGAVIATGSQIFDVQAVSFEVVAADTHQDAIRLEIEVRPGGVTFSNVATASSPFMPGGRLEVYQGFAPGSYSWQWRVVDTFEAAGPWTPFEGTDGASVDFVVEADGSSSGGGCGAASTGIDGVARWAFLLVAGLAASRLKLRAVAILVFASALPARAQEAVPPDPVSDLRATAGEDFIYVTWTEPDGITGGFDLYASTAGPMSDAEWDPAGTFDVGEPLPVAPGTRHGVEIGGLEPGRRYWFAIWAWNGEGLAGVVTDEHNATATPTGVDPDPGPWPTPYPFPVPSPAPIGASVPGSWSDSPGLPSGMGEHQCTFVAAGAHIYCMPDSRGELKFHRFDPATRTWQGLAPVTVVDEDHTVSGSMTWLPGTNHIYLSLLGRHTRFFYGWWSAFYRYDISRNAWSEMEAVPLPTPDQAAISIGAAKDKVYAIAGTSGNHEFYEYAPDSGTWSRPGALPYPLYSYRTALAGSGEFLYVLHPNGNRFWRYDTASRLWTTSDGSPGVVAPLPVDDYLTLNKGEDGVLYALGSGIHRYDTAKNSWTTPAPTPCAIGRGGAVAWPGSDDRLYIARGAGIASGDRPNPDLWTYVIFGDRFLSDLSPAPAPVGALVGARSHGALFALSQVPETGDAVPLRYSIADDAWATLPALPFHGDGYALTYDGGDHCHALSLGQNDGAMRLYRLPIAEAGSSWVEVATLAVPRPEGPGNNAPVVGQHLVWGGGDFLFMTTNYYHFYRYAMSAGTWTRIDTPSTGIGVGLVPSYPGRGDRLYLCYGSHSTWQDSRWEDGAFWAYSVSTGEWTELMAPGDRGLPKEDIFTPPVSLIGSDNDYLWGFHDGSFLRYSIPEDAWVRTPMAAPASVSQAFAYAGGSRLYALQDGSARLMAYRMFNEAPDPPSELAQFHPGGWPEVGPGGELPVLQAVLLQAAISDPDGDEVRLEVKVQETGASFDDIEAVPGPLVSSGSTGTVIVSGIVPGVSYQWQVRAVDALGVESAWVPFGSPDADEVDFSNRANGAPALDGLAQVNGVTGEIIPAGTNTPDGTVILRAMAVDPDGVDAVRLEVEVLAAGGRFTGIPTGISSQASSGSLLSATLVLGQGAWQWRCRAVDEHGAAGPWSRFGSGDAADFRILPLGSIGGAGCGASSAGGGWRLGWIALVAGLALARRARPVLVFMGGMLSISHAAADHDEGGPPGKHGMSLQAVSSFRATEVGTYEITLAWTAHDAAGFYDGFRGPVDSYELRHSENPGAAFEAMDISTAELLLPGAEGVAESGLITGLRPGRTYSFILRSWFTSRWCGHDCWIDSARISATMVPDPVPPRMIDDLEAVLGYQGRIALGWTLPADPDIEEIQVRYSTSGPILTIAEFTSALPIPGLPLAEDSRRTLDLESTVPGTQYWFSIRAVDYARNLGPLPSNSPSVMVPAGIPSPAGSSSSGCGQRAGIGTGLGALAAAVAAFAVLGRLRSA